MRSTKIFFNLSLIILLVSCGNRKNSEKEILVDDGKSEIVGEKEEIVPFSSSLDDEIDVADIKSQLDAVTTTFLSKGEVGFYQDRKKNNFYGDYTLIKNDNAGNATRIVGNMVVYDSINPYIYEKDTDEFVEITLIDKGVTLLGGELEVGISHSNLLEKFGEKYQKINNTLIFTKENKIAFFVIKDSLVSKIKIGIYKDNVNIEEILHKSNW